MPKYLITREVPGIGNLAPDQLRDLSARSNAALARLEGRAQWVHSYVTGDRLFCVYHAENEDAVREHARVGGFPCDDVTRIGAVIDPATGGA